MMYYIKLGFVLLLISGIAAGILAFINGKTEPIIQMNAELEESNARAEVLPDVKDFVLDSLAVEVAAEEDPLKMSSGGGGGQFYYYIGKDEAGNTIGYVFKAYGKGYSSTVQTMVGVKVNEAGEFVVNKIKITYQSETPGLGANCTSDNFMGQFAGQTPATLAVDKDGGKITSITGATITSRAVTNSIRQGIENLKTATEGAQS